MPAPPCAQGNGIPMLAQRARRRGTLRGQSAALRTGSYGLSLPTTATEVLQLRPYRQARKRSIASVWDGRRYALALRGDHPCRPSRGRAEEARRDILPTRCAPSARRTGGLRQHGPRRHQASPANALRPASHTLRRPRLRANGEQGLTTSILQGRIVLGIPENRLSGAGSCGLRPAHRNRWLCLAANGSGYPLTAQRQVGYNSPVRAPRERGRSGFIKAWRARIQNAE